MTKFLVETRLSVKLRRIFEVEAADADTAREIIEDGLFEDDPISEVSFSVPGDEVVVSVEEKPDDGAQVLLRFIPQAWIRDYAVSVDLDGPDTWHVSKAMLLERFPTETAWNEAHEDRDSMRQKGDAPRWIRDWSGPFNIELATGESPWE